MRQFAKGASTLSEDRKTLLQRIPWWWRQEGRWVLALVLLAATPRAVFLVQARGNLYFNEFNDFPFYHNWAQAILQGQPGPTVFPMGPLYPYLLALFYGVFGTRPEPVLWLQALMGALSCALIAILGRMVFGRKVGLLAGLLGAVYAPAIFYTGVLLTATALYLLNLSMLISVHWALARRRWYVWIVPGILLGLSALGRANVLFFLPFLWVGIFHLARNLGPGRLRCLGAMAVLLLGVLLTLAPVTAHNVTKGHDLVPLTSNMGLNLYIGNNPDAPGYYQEPRGLYLDGGDFLGYRAARALTGEELKPSQVSRFWSRRALEFAVEQPGVLAGLTLRKLLFFWNAYEIPQAEHLGFFERFAPLLNWPWLGFSVIGPLGLLGMALSLGPGRWRRAYFLLTFVGALMIATVLFFILARLRLQVCSVLLIFAAYALIWLWDALNTRRRRPLVPAFLALIALSLLVNWRLPVLDPARDLAKSHNLLATHHALEGDLQGALREYNRSLAIAPQLATTYLDLAQIYHALGRFDEVWGLQRKALEVDPQVAMAHLNMGNLYAQDGRWDRAIAEYRAEIASNPYNAQAYEKLAAAEREKAMVGSGRSDALQSSDPDSLQSPPP
jgi:tetratricopeptide (TPR) repeat protein